MERAIQRELMDYKGGQFEGTLIEALEMEVVELVPERAVVRMPVGPKVRQPFGLLHGGASVALAETAASLGSTLHVDLETQAVVGMEINANHLRARRDGHVTAEATLLHKGRSSLIWDIRIRDDEGKLVCVSRCTVAIVARQK
jgi:uncharacterized protein (TIGR00369 family)